MFDIIPNFRVLILTALAVVTFEPFEADAISCYYCAYNGEPLADKEAYPCHRNNKPGVGLMGKEECTQGETACFFTLAISDRPDGKKTAYTTGGCLHEKTKQCRENRVKQYAKNDFVYNLKGGCITSKLTVREGEMVNSCWWHPEPGLRRKREQIDGLEYPQQRTMCSCSGDLCNGPGGQIEDLK